MPRNLLDRTSGWNITTFRIGGWPCHKLPHSTATSRLRRVQNTRDQRFRDHRVELFVRDGSDASYHMNEIKLHTSVTVVVLFVGEGGVAEFLVIVGRFAEIIEEIDCFCL